MKHINLIGKEWEHYFCFMGLRTCYSTRTYKLEHVGQMRPAKEVSPAPRDCLNIINNTAFIKQR
jgi:hypothetical protein